MKNHARALLAVSAGLIGLFCAGTGYARFQTDLHSQAKLCAPAPPGMCGSPMLPFRI